MTTAVGDYRSELLRELAAEHEQRGEGHAVLTVLDARGIAVPPAVRERILACTDLAQLDTWLRRATTASTADEVVRG
jgi:predicted transglutaminase-like cysteine proteinase